MKRKKGIWNQYKGRLRIELQQFCEENQIAGEQFHLLNIYQWENIYRQVVEHFADKSRSYQAELHWLNINGAIRGDKEILAVFDSREAEDWIRKLPGLVEHPEGGAYLLLEENSQRPKFWIGEGTLEGIAMILDEGLYDSDYYIVDKKYRWMITCNHHQVILFVGEGLNLSGIRELVDSTAKCIMDQYVSDVNAACHKLLAGINAEEHLDLKTKWDFMEYRNKTRKMEFTVGGTVYRLHGRGCFAFSRDQFLNWDFGYRSRWCGIDPQTVGMTLRENKSGYTEYYDGSRLKEACEQAVKRGDMFEKHGLYYDSIRLEDTFLPDFPVEYDTLVVEHFGRSWVIPGNKLIDRFMRKSHRISKQVYRSENLYMLRFYLDGREIYSIPYDDVCYPEPAVRIMSDDILRNVNRS